MSSRSRAVAAPRWILALSAALLAGASLAFTVVKAQEPRAPEDPLRLNGYVVTGGAAPGYVEDRACGSCHADLWRSYREVAMARSFYRPLPGNRVENLDAAPYYHEASRRYYQMVDRDGTLVMRRHQLDAAGEPINVVEQTVDWILGSGNHSRTYLYRTPSGELFQLPLAWYSQTGRWGMAPGFDRADHLGLERHVRRECMFCHNAYPDVAVGSDAYEQPHVYPEILPQGIGCQRCHGPGAEHARLGMRRPIELGALRAAIVNPGKLEPRRRDDICYACHMQPSVAIPGQRVFGRGDYSFRPGESLADYLVVLDVVEQGRARGERFEINHHPYRLQQSRCFQASEGALGCLSCHDPHRKVAAEDRVAHYRRACLTCHQGDACSRERSGAQASALHAADDCAGCHMPRRRTEDVVQVVMTDHLIRRPTGEARDLLAPRSERDPDIDDVVFHDPGRAPQGGLGEIYRAYVASELTGGRHEEALATLQRLVPRLAASEPELWFAIARGLLEQQHPAEAVEALRRILERAPRHVRAREMRAVASARSGRLDAGIAELRALLAEGGEWPEARYNLGLLLLGAGRAEDALAELERAAALRPTMHAAWYYRGIALSDLERDQEAIASLRRSLELAPNVERGYLALGRLLLRSGQREEALRYWRHGARQAQGTGALAEALASLEAETATQAEGSAR